ncbi:MAG: methyltransferase domain-containing protein [Gammaproteobacteria bacterium]
MLLEQLREGAHETKTLFSKEIFYRLEREIGHRFFRREPPERGSPRLLNLGAGPLYYKDWINADDFAFKRSIRERAFSPDWRLDITRPWKCRNDFWDGIFSQHVIEHVSYADAVHVLEECHRTMKPGAWLRVSVPDARIFAAGYLQQAPSIAGYAFLKPALALSFLTQMHYHKSTWDADLMCALLEEIGFESVREVVFGAGSDPRLVMDQDAKREESLYVEARKVGAASEPSIS